MAVVATGFFDGVHLGHREVITTLVSSARKKGEEALVVTFDASENRPPTGCRKIKALDNAAGKGAIAAISWGG